MSNSIKILHLEDLSSDAELVERVLKKGSFDFELCLVDNKVAFENALDGFSPDIIISDHSLPSFDSLGALALLKQKKLNIPFILVTAAMSEEFAVLVMKQGADDYILKDRMQRLPNAVLGALEKKRIEKEYERFLDQLIFNEAQLKETEQLANIGSFKTDLVNNSINWSEQLYYIFDYDPGEVDPSMDNFFKRIHPDDSIRIRNAYENAISNGSAVQLDYRIVIKNGSVRFIHSEVYLSRDSQGRVTQLTGFTQDVTRNKKAEAKILKAYRLYAFISQVNQTIIHSDNQLSVFKEVCRIAIDTGEFDMAWVGIVNTKKKTIDLVEQCGLEAEDIKRLTTVSYQANDAKKYVIAMNTYFICNDIEKEPKLSNSQSFASKQGFGSCIMLPVRKSDAVFGIVNLYTSAINFFDLEEIKLLEEVTQNISFAIDNFEKERKRKAVQEKLAHNEAILKEAQTMAHLGSWQFNPLTGLTKWSDEACNIFGLPSKDNLHPYNFWLTYIHPEDLQFVLNVFNTPKQKKESSFNFRIIRKDGNVRYIHSRTQNHYDNVGKLVGINGIVHDVTDEKKAELKLKEKEMYLRGILDSAENGILALDNNGKIINYNRRFVELWDISFEILKKKDNSDFLNHIVSQLLDSENFISKVEKLHHLNRESVDFLELKDGRIFERYFNPIILNEESVGRVWSFRDISERRKHLQAIKEQNKKLREIAWIQSHVVRAPLSRILGLVDIIRNSSPTEVDVDELLGYVFNSANELDDVIKAIVHKTENVVRQDSYKSLN